MNDDIQIPLPYASTAERFSDAPLVTAYAAMEAIGTAIKLDRQRRGESVAPTDDEIIDLALATEHGGEAGSDEPRLHYFRDSDIVEFALRLLRLNGTSQAQPDHSAGVSKMVGPDDHVAQPLNMVEPVAVLRYERSTPGSENEMPTVVSCNWMPDGEYRVYLGHDAAQAHPDQFRGATEMIGGNACTQDREDAERYRWLVTHCRTTPEHWGGRWSIVIEGLVPEQPGDKAAIDAAINAAMGAV